MSDTDIIREARELCEKLREMLPEKVSYAEMVGAEKFMGDMYVYEDQEPYIIEGAAKHMDVLLDLLTAKDAEIARLTKALHKADIDCDHCKHSHGGECENADFDCMTCDCDCICKSCRDNSNWEWRGAGEG